MKQALTSKDSTQPVSLVVFGARSYTAGELLRLLALHPVIKPVALVSQSSPGLDVHKVHPHLQGFFSGMRTVSEEQGCAVLKADPAAAFALCTGSGESAAQVARLGQAGLLEGRIGVDVSGDFRLRDAQAYAHWYEQEHPAANWISRFDYCIPELHRERSRSPLVSNPGCFATAVQLAVWPAVHQGLVERDLRICGITGSSGSGATVKSNTHHPTRAHEVYAYRPLKHQHTPEIRMGLGLDASWRLSFVAHSAPIVRGISATALMRLAPGIKAEALISAYRTLCEREPMLQWCEEPPKLTGIIGTNIARLSVSVEDGAVAAHCAIDNLTRGASGQALQNLNRVLGLAETTGLVSPGMAPV